MLTMVGARRMWLSTLQKYHENNREHKLRDEQAQYLLRLKQGIEARILEQGIETRISEQRIMSESISSDHMTIEEEL